MMTSMDWVLRADDAFVILFNLGHPFRIEPSRHVASGRLEAARATTDKAARKISVPSVLLKQAQYFNQT